MATEVLLMADVPDLGAEGSVVNVADGYARNYLFPKKLAAPVTKGAHARLAVLRENREKARSEELAAARELAGRLSGCSCTIAVKTGTDEKMYGSVSNADIAQALEKQGMVIDRHKIELDAPLKELGVFDVRVKLRADVNATVKVWIVEE
jgi:large subunit ribosomal protein L9